jgi:hypothetical protein
VTFNPEFVAMPPNNLRQPTVSQLRCLPPAELAR